MADMSDNGYRTMLCVEAAIASEAGVTVAPGEAQLLHRDHLSWMRFR